jgi:hypothetical protein
VKEFRNVKEMKEEYGERMLENIKGIREDTRKRSPDHSDLADFGTCLRFEE